MKIKNMKVQEFLDGTGRDACREGREWALANCATLRDVWEKCERADWMLWMLHMLDVYDQSISRFLAKMLREQPIHGGKTLFDLLEDERSRKCVEVLEQFLDGKATKEELKKARDAAAAITYSTATTTTATYVATYVAVAAAAAAATYSTATTTDAYVAAAAVAAAASLWQAKLLRSVVPVEWEEISVNGSDRK